MNETVLHHVWQHRLFYHTDLKTDKGEPIEIIDVGKKNTDAGPDFFNAKIKIGNTVWAGNVEIHLHSSDWYKHRHQEDAAYENVILHVVVKADIEVKHPNGVVIPQLELRFSDNVTTEMDNFLNEEKEFPCFDKITEIHPVFLSDWKNALLHERMRQKFAEIRVERDLVFDKDEICYRFICRAFGTHVNSIAFQQLSLSIPLKLVQKLRTEPFRLEALFFGQSGLLETINQPDEFELKLINEYLFLKRKYSLKSLPPSIWKFARTRPGNFPWIRISQFVYLLESVDSLSELTDRFTDVIFLKEFFSELKAKNSWVLKCTQNVHITGKPGDEFSQSLIINAVIPFIFTFASYNGNENLIEKALDWLSKLKAEENRLIRIWQKAGLKFQSAMDTQAFIYLSKNYCADKKCLRCRIGHQVLKNIVSNENEHI